MENNTSLFGDIVKKISHIEHKSNNPKYNILLEEQYEQIIKFEKILDYIDNELKENEHLDEKKINEYLINLRKKYLRSLIQSTTNEKYWTAVNVSGKFFNEFKIKYTHDHLYNIELTCYFIDNSVNVFYVNKHIVIDVTNKLLQIPHIIYNTSLKQNLLVRTNHELLDVVDHINNLCINI
jgi:hypothetical protein